MNTIRNKFYRACADWKREDHTLAVVFKAAPIYSCVEQAVCEMLDVDYEELPADFHIECIELIRARDTELRSKLLHIRRKREGENKSQLSFDFN